MQWLIDIVFGIVMSRFQGLIVLWSGSIVDIPDSWALCDGSQGTPDLTDKFILGASSGTPPSSTGGASTHSHAVTSTPHLHTIPAATGIAAGTDYSNLTESEAPTGSTDSVNNVPPYYALAYIMKL